MLMHKFSKRESTLFVVNFLIEGKKLEMICEKLYTLSYRLRYLIKDGEKVWQAFGLRKRLV